MKLSLRSFCLLLLLAAAYESNAQLYKIELDEKVNNSSLIVEGKVIAKKSFWNDAHTLIFTANTVKVYKVFKGDVKENTIEVLTQGGVVANKAMWVSDLLQLDIGKTGLFFCEPNRIALRSPFTQKVLYDVYSSDQGFFRYNLFKDEAWAPFASYKKIKDNLYKLVQQKTKQDIKVIDNSFDASSINSQNQSNGAAGSLAGITSFSPTTVHGGALKDPPNNVLTINGNGFGTKPSGSCAVLFKDGNNDNQTPDYEVPYTSSYFISWSDTKIVLKVPDRAATGTIAVTLKDGTTVESSSELNVFYSIINLDFDFSSLGIDTVVSTEPRLMNMNNAGGYTIQYSTNTAGNGKNFATSSAKDAFERALATWKDAVGVNFTIGATTTTQKVADDGVNLVVFDNKNTGYPPMASGVLESTYSYGTVCYQQSPFQIGTAEKTGFDILVRNSGVSVGNISFEDGPCFPASNTYDRETIVLHELGHAINLAHINDDAQGNTLPYVNPEKVMHYAILDYIDRRSLDVSAYEGGLYMCEPKHYTDYCSGDAEMTQLSKITLANDNCPGSFPTEATPDGTSQVFDLVHATSNKLTDPQYTAVTCDGKGTQVTNNAYYAYRTGTQTTLTINIANYVTVPEELASCAGQGVRLAVYDVSTCPDGQNFPAPVGCQTFGSGGTINISGLAANHDYLLYFDGVRNTKATFTATFNGDSSVVPPTSSIRVYPNPVVDQLTVEITSTASAKYSYAVYDILGRKLYQNEISVTSGIQFPKIPFRMFAPGVYVLKLVSEDGKTVLTKKIVR